MTETLLVRGGRVVDPALGRDGLFDVVVEDGRISRVVAPGSESPDSHTKVVDAQGKVVTPGLIDFHVHVYRWVSIYGVDADRAGVLSGATTIVDQGSAGHYTFPGFRHYVAERAATDVYAFLMINAVGMPQGGVRCAPLFCPETAEVDEAVGCVEANRDLIRGIKGHIDPHAAARWGLKTFDRAVEAARRAGVPLYAHTGSLIPKDPSATPVDPDALFTEAVARLDRGDIVTHCFGRMPGTAVKRDKTINPAALDAAKRGVLFDVGYGVHFSWESAEAALEGGLRPFICSSDIHGDFRLPPRDDPKIDYSLVGAMNRMLALGFSVAEVVAMTSPNPARVLQIEDRAGALRGGMPAAITVLEMETGDLEVEDSFGKKRRATTRLKPHLVIKGSRIVEADRNLPEYAALTA